MNENAGDSNSIFGRAAGTAMGVGAGALGIGGGVMLAGAGGDRLIRGKYNKETGEYATGRKVKQKGGSKGAGDNVPTVEAEVVENMDKAVNKMKEGNPLQLESRSNKGKRKVTQAAADKVDNSIIYQSGEVSEDYIKAMTKMNNVPKNLIPEKTVSSTVKKVVNAVT